MTQQELIKLLRDQGYTPQDLMKAGVGVDGYTKGVGVLQNGVDIFDVNQDGKVDSRDSLDYARAPIQVTQVPQESQEEQFQEPSSLANPLTTTAEDPFSLEQPNEELRTSSDLLLTETSSDTPYYGQTKELRNTYGQSVLEDINKLPTDESGFIDLSSQEVERNYYQEWLDSYDPETKKFTLGDPNADNQFMDYRDSQTADVTTFDEQRSFQNYGLTLDQQNAFGENLSSIYNESYTNLKDLQTENPEQFLSTFSNLTLQPQLSFLYKEKENNNITQDQYLDAVLYSLQTENSDKPYFKYENKIYTSSPSKNINTFDINKDTPYEVMIEPDLVWNMPKDVSGQGPLVSDQKDYFLNVIGNTGKVTDDFDTSMSEFILNNPITQIAASVNPMIRIAVTAGKLATGQDLSTGDIVGTVMTGLDMAGLVTAPSGVDVDGVGPPNIGQGFGGLSYQQTQGLITSAIDGDPTALITSTVVPTLLDNTLDSLPEDSRIGGIFQSDDLKEGLTTVVSEVASGANFNDALASGLGTYVEEGGGLNIEGVDVDLGPLEDVVKAVVEPIVDIVADIGSSIDDTILQPIKDSLPLDEIADAGRVVDDTVLQPVKNTVETLGSTLDDTIIQPVIKTVEELVDIELPDVDIDLPEVDIDLPEVDIDLPKVDIDLPRIGLLANRTTEGLFGSELSKFKKPDFSYDEIQDYIRKRYA